jgi:hypothetical protein
LTPSTTEKEKETLPQGLTDSDGRNWRQTELIKVWKPLPLTAYKETNLIITQNGTTWEAPADLKPVF